MSLTTYKFKSNYIFSDINVKEEVTNNLTNNRKKKKQIIKSYVLDNFRWI